MDVSGFVKWFVEPNTLIRLWYKVEGGHQEVIPDDKPMMEHGLVKSEYAHREVAGITDILYQRSNYSEAVNLVII